MSEALTIYEKQDKWNRLSKIEIDITNPTGLPQTINLFAYSIQSVSTQYPALVFDNPSDYDILVQELENQPIKASKILFVCTSQSQLANPVAVQTKDSDGHQESYVEFPIIGVDTYQRQGNRVEVLFDELILDTFTSFAGYQINAGETATIVLYYRRMNKWCFVTHPELFAERKSISGVIKDNISEKFCDREEKFRDQDTDSKCKEGKKRFQMVMTNNSSVQQVINLFDNFTLSSAENLTASVDTVTTNAGDFSQTRFFERPSTGLGYTAGGGILTSDIVSYDQFANPNVEASFGIGVVGITVSTKQDTMYAVSSALPSVFIYQLGSGIAPTTFAVGLVSSAVLVDDVNDFIFLFTTGVNIRRYNLPNLTSPTNFSTGTPKTTVVPYYDTVSSRLIYSRSVAGVPMITAVNGITGVLTDIAVLSAGDLVKSLFFVEDWNAVIYTYTSGGVNFLVALDSGNNVIGTVNTGLFTAAEMTYDSDKEQLIVSRSVGLNILFLSLSDIIGGVVDRTLNIGVSSGSIGYLTASQTVLLGKKAQQAVSALNLSPSIEFSDPDAYNFFTESLGEEPIKASCLDVISTNQQQLVNNIVVQDKDANGYVHSSPIPPIITVATMQDQGNRAFIKFVELVLDGNTTFASYPINAGETVTFVMYYRQFKRASLLGSGMGQKVSIQKQRSKDAKSKEKNVIFDVEQVYSDGLSTNRADSVMPNGGKTRVKFTDTRAGCAIPKADPQILYVDPNDVSFGSEEDFPVLDISDQGYSQFDETAERKWTYADKKKYLRKRKQAVGMVARKKLKPRRN